MPQYSEYNVGQRYTPTGVISLVGLPMVQNPTIPLGGQDSMEDVNRPSSGTPFSYVSTSNEVSEVVGPACRAPKRPGPVRVPRTGFGCQHRVTHRAHFGPIMDGR